jgi:hypothetical protein
MKPNWLPNWRDESLYPQQENTTITQWAWEFLRRNPNYQDDYNKYKELGENCLRGEIPYLDEAPDYYLGFDLRRSKKDEEYKQIITGPTISEHREYLVIKTPYNYFCSKYGLRNFFPDPACNNPTIQFQYLGVSYFSFTDIPIPGGLKPKRPAEIAVIFHLDLSLERQLKEMKKFLIKEKERLIDKEAINCVEKRNRAEQYKEYLRILDADISEASTKEIAEAIYPDQSNEYPDYTADKAVNHDLKAAKKLRDNDYRFLPYLHNNHR